MNAKFSLLESWHNGTDNAVDELYCQSNQKANLEETLAGLTQQFLNEGLGFDFPSGTVRKEIDEKDNIVFFIGKDRASSEHWRSFRIVEEKPHWEFKYEEEYPDSVGKNFAGILTDGEHFLFWHALKNFGDDTETCYIFDSIPDLCQTQNAVCSYPWTSENDEILLNALNNLKDPTDYCGEGSPIATLKFSS